MEVRAREVPDCIDYLTQNKVYKAYGASEEFGRGYFLFNIVDDLGDEITCNIKECAHLNFGDWEVINE